MKRLMGMFFPLMLLAASCGKGDNAPKVASMDESADSAAIRVAYLPVLDALPYYVAEERGMFEKEGLKVKLVPFNAHMDVDTALAGGSIDGAFTDIIRCEYLRKKQGTQLDYLTTTELAWSLVSNKAARLNKLEQFGDKMVAMTRFSATDYLTDVAFKDVKTSANVFKVQINDVDVRLKMLLNNELDALWLSEPLTTEARKAGHKQIVKPSDNKDKLGVLAFRKSLKGKGVSESDLKKLSKAYSSACDSINKNGLQAYAPEIMKYCKVDTAVVNRIPRVVYSHAEKPSQELIEKAKGFLK